MQCSTCRWFQSTNKFCRVNPPVPLLIKKDGIHHVSAKFPVIPFPDNDFCSLYEMSDEIHLESNNGEELIIG
jgi:hypothetical protein